jgi:Cu2+-containing amine oxidase
MAVLKYGSAGLIFFVSISLLSATSAQVVACGESNCPFDDLSAAEIKLVMEIIQSTGAFPPSIKYPIIRTQEPKKAEWLAGTAFDQRLAYAALFNTDNNILTEVIIDLKTQNILERTDLRDGIAPPIMFEEYTEAEAVIRQSRIRCSSKETRD